MFYHVRKDGKRRPFLFIQNVVNPYLDSNKETVLVKSFLPKIKNELSNVVSR